MCQESGMEVETQHTELVLNFFSYLKQKAPLLFKFSSKVVLMPHLHNHPSESLDMFLLCCSPCQFGPVGQISFVDWLKTGGTSLFITSSIYRRWLTDGSERCTLCALKMCLHFTQYFSSTLFQNWYNYSLSTHLQLSTVALFMWCHACVSWVYNIYTLLIELNVLMTAPIIHMGYAFSEMHAGLCTNSFWRKSEE